MANSDPEDEKALLDFLSSNKSVKFIRLHWFDLSGILRTRFLPKQHCLRLAAGPCSYGVGPACLTGTVAQADGPPLFQRLVELRPDWTSLRICGYATKHASVMCSLYFRDSDNPFSKCPRHLLSRTLDSCEEQGVSFQVGFEIEFILFNELGQLSQDLDSLEAWSTTTGLRGEKLLMMEEIAAALDAAAIPVYHFHAEAPPQLELALEPLPPIQAVDCLAYTQETIKHICISHGYKATMAPKPLLQPSVFSSLHTHISISPADEEDYFLAALLQSIQSLCAFGLANYDSYERVRDDSDTIGTWISWGTENRDTPIRKIDSGHWELRIVDSTANLYLFLAVAIAIGVRGIQEKRELRIQDCRMYPSVMTPTQRQERGIEIPLPQTLNESITCMRGDSGLRMVVGEDILDLYVEVKTRDEGAFQRMNDDERRKLFIKLF